MTTDIPNNNANCGTESSCCRPAVQRAYNELRRCGQPDRYAFEAAVAVYRYHHPESQPRQAEVVVSEWVWDGISH
jgi:hypothetical protein